MGLESPETHRHLRIDFPPPLLQEASALVVRGPWFWMIREIISALVS